jgi:EAL domain-containing protein (putative c-di-GMP-specific phosphodiesterase class I)
MRHNDWPRIAGLASFSVLAIGCAAFLIASGDLHKSVAGVALLLLAAGQIALLIGGALRQSRLGDRQAVQGRALREVADRTQALTARIDALEARLAAPAPAAPQATTSSTLAEMQALREQLQALVNDIQNPGAPPPAAAPETAAAAAPLRERLDLLLEPVIELSSGDTNHYRALLNMVDDQGQEVAHADLMAKAEENGVRPRLDQHLLRQVLPVFRRLRLKHPAMRLFVPLGAASLNTSDDLARLIALLEQSSDVAPGVVLEISHQSLGLLSAAGIEGLARLGRLGTNMCLARVSLTGLDLMSLRQLGVRFLDIDARGFEQGHGVAPSWTEFAQFARSMQFQIVAGHVETAAQSLAAGRLARFGYGPYFAPPRRVRVDAGETQPASRYQAA